MSVSDNIAYGVRLRNKRSRRGNGSAEIDMDDRVSKMMEMVGLEGYGRRMTSTLSGGERQRVAVARALAPDPKLLLFDEPLSALDAPLRSRLREEIRTLQQKLGITTIYVTHDRDEALSMSDLIVVMKDGGVVESGTPRTLYRSPETLFTAQFLGEGSVIEVDGNSSFFRPEHAQVELSPGSGRFRGTLLSLRYYGGWAIARILPEKGDEITVRIPESTIDLLETRIGGNLGFDIPDESLLTFSNPTDN
jgi:ABC-type Fe3+/spermidine/putrescine transport system ATPase subunit